MLALTYPYLYLAMPPAARVRCWMHILQAASLRMARCDTCARPRKISIRGNNRSVRHPKRVRYLSYRAYLHPMRLQAPPVLDPVRLTPEANAVAARVLPDGGRALLAVNITLIDTNGIVLGNDASVTTAELQRVRPDAVLLCYAADEPSSLVRVVDYWLPLIRDANAAKPHWPYTPVALCGTKEELFEEGKLAVDCDGPHCCATNATATIQFRATTLHSRHAVSRCHYSCYAYCSVGHGVD